MLSQKIIQTMHFLDEWNRSGQPIPMQVQKTLFIIMRSWSEIAKGMECGVIPVTEKMPNSTDRGNVIQFRQRKVIPIFVPGPGGAA